MLENEKYLVETVYPYHFFFYDTLPEARRKKKDLQKKGIKSSIVVKTGNGNDYIID